MITVAEPLSAGLKMTDGFPLSVEIATNCDSDKFPILSQCFLVIFQLFQYFINILILARWIPGWFGLSGAVKKVW